MSFAWGKAVTIAAIFMLLPAASFAATAPITIPCAQQYDICLKQPNSNKNVCQDNWRKCMSKCMVTGNSCNPDTECQKHCTEVATSQGGKIACCAPLVGPEQENKCPQMIDYQCKANDAKPTDPAKDLGTGNVDPMNPGNDEHLPETPPASQAEIDDMVNKAFDEACPGCTAEGVNPENSPLTDAEFDQVSKGAIDQLKDYANNYLGVPDSQLPSDLSSADRNFFSDLNRNWGELMQPVDFRPPSDIPDWALNDFDRALRADPRFNMPDYVPLGQRLFMQPFMQASSFPAPLNMPTPPASLPGQSWAEAAQNWGNQIQKNFADAYNWTKEQLGLGPAPDPQAELEQIAQQPQQPLPDFNSDDIWNQPIANQDDVARQLQDIANADIPLDGSIVDNETLPPPGQGQGPTVTNPEQNTQIAEIFKNFGIVSGSDLPQGTLYSVGIDPNYSPSSVGAIAYLPASLAGDFPTGPIAIDVFSGTGDVASYNLAELAQDIGTYEGRMGLMWGDPADFETFSPVDGLQMEVEELQGLRDAATDISDWEYYNEQYIERQDALEQAQQELAAKNLPEGTQINEPGQVTQEGDGAPLDTVERGEIANPDRRSVVLDAAGKTPQQLANEAREAMGLGPNEKVLGVIYKDTGKALFTPADEFAIREGTTDMRASTDGVVTVQKGYYDLAAYMSGNEANFDDAFRQSLQNGDWSKNADAYRILGPEVMDPFTGRTFGNEAADFIQGKEATREWKAACTLGDAFMGNKAGTRADVLLNTYEPSVTRSQIASAVPVELPDTPIQTANPSTQDFERFAGTNQQPQQQPSQQQPSQQQPPQQNTAQGPGQQQPQPGGSTGQGDRPTIPGAGPGQQNRENLWEAVKDSLRQFSPISPAYSTTPQTQGIPNPAPQQPATVREKLREIGDRIVNGPQPRIQLPTQPQTPPTQTTQPQTTVTVEQYLRNQRAPFFEELDKDAALRREVIALLNREHTNPNAMQGVLERMANGSNQRGYTSFKQTMHDGFYGPVNRGEVAADLRRGLTPGEIARGEQAMAKVREGSNICDFCTDQGKEPEVHPNGRKNIGGEFFGNMAGSPKWANQQRARIAEANGQGLPSKTFFERARDTAKKVVETVKEAGRRGEAFREQVFQQQNGALNGGSPLPEGSIRGAKIAVSNVARNACASFNDCKPTSGLRSRAANEEAGGAESSQHINGRAIDLTVPADKALEFVQNVKTELCRVNDCKGGIGYYGVNQKTNRAKFHVDTRDARNGWGPNHSKKTIPAGPVGDEIRAHINGQKPTQVATSQQQPAAQKKSAPALPTRPVTNVVRGITKPSTSVPQQQAAPTPPQFTADAGDGARSAPAPEAQANTGTQQGQQQAGTTQPATPSEPTRFNTTLNVDGYSSPFKLYGNPYYLESVGGNQGAQTAQTGPRLPGDIANRIKGLDDNATALARELDKFYQPGSPRPDVLSRDLNNAVRRTANAYNRLKTEIETNRASLDPSLLQRWSEIESAAKDIVESRNSLTPGLLTAYETEISRGMNRLGSSLAGLKGSIPKDVARAPSQSPFTLRPFEVSGQVTVMQIAPTPETSQSSDVVQETEQASNVVEGQIETGSAPPPQGTQERPAEESDDEEPQASPEEVEQRTVRGWAIEALANGRRAAVSAAEWMNQKLAELNRANSVQAPTNGSQQGTGQTSGGGGTGVGEQQQGSPDGTTQEQKPAEAQPPRPQPFTRLWQALSDWWNQKPEGGVAGGPGANAAQGSGQGTGVGDGQGSGTGDTSGSGGTTGSGGAAGSGSSGGQSGTQQSGTQAGTGQGIGGWVGEKLSSLYNMIVGTVADGTLEIDTSPTGNVPPPTRPDTSLLPDVNPTNQAIDQFAGTNQPTPQVANPSDQDVDQFADSTQQPPVQPRPGSEVPPPTRNPARESSERDAVDARTRALTQGIGNAFGGMNPMNALMGLGNLFQGLNALNGGQPYQQQPFPSQPPIVVQPPPIPQPGTTTPPILRPSVAFIANPNAIDVGGTSRLTWTALRANECVVKYPNGNVLMRGNAQGSATTTALSQTTVFTLMCGGNGGTRDVTATVYVGEEPPASAPSQTTQAAPTLNATSGTGGATSGTNTTDSNQQNKNWCDPGMDSYAFIACLEALPGY